MEERKKTRHISEATSSDAAGLTEGDERERKKTHTHRGREQPVSVCTDKCDVQSAALGDTNLI